MRLRLLLTFCATLAACASPSAPAAVAVSPVNKMAPAVPPTPSADSAPSDWQLLDAVTDSVQGTGIRRAERELLAGRTPARTVVVAVIDGGVDTAHADLRTQLWRNERETPNGRDDDGNGYADDTWGWNYIGGADGRNVDVETLELTREYARCTKTATSAPPECATIKAAFEAKRVEAEQEATQLQQMATVYARVISVLRTTLGGDSVTPERVAAIVPANDTVAAAQDIYMRLEADGITGKAIEEASQDAERRLTYGLNPEYNPRTIVGDDPTNGADRRYGNRDVTGPDAGHGTHVAGIIGAARGNEGIDGAATSVRLMAVRAVPNGDERDKDVANAIRYAVDNGAHIINMSFGKDYSPEKHLVDEAVKYADSKGVLMVHAAGNDGKNLATEHNYPSPAYLGGGRAKHWIEVGASSWKGGQELAASFSNYGKAEVDLFSPGEDILSTAPGGGYERNSGTSMAAPVVTGVAAMLMSYFPKLSAADVRQLIIETAARYPSLMVLKPGSPNGETVPFSELSVTGGVVDAYAAVKAALARESATP
ncbi:MAG TPA: S8 family peptidase [Gemmatimonadales bacterium]|nr:S8 family peptidase [Gemmatimonadales bacterium]